MIHVKRWRKGKFRTPLERNNSGGKKVFFAPTFFEEARPKKGWKCPDRCQPWPSNTSFAVCCPYHQSSGYRYLMLLTHQEEKSFGRSFSWIDYCQQSLYSEICSNLQKSSVSKFVGSFAKCFCFFITEISPFLLNIADVIFEIRNGILVRKTIKK
jgi:hypothetical protein